MKIMISFMAVFSIILMSCVSEYHYIGKGSDQKDTTFTINGSTTAPEELFFAAGQLEKDNAISYATRTKADEELLKAKSEAAIDSAIAEAIRKASETFKDNPQNVEAVERIIGKWVLKDLFGENYNTMYPQNNFLASGGYLEFEIKRQLARQKFSMFHNDPAINPWLRR